MAESNEGSGGEAATGLGQCARPDQDVLPVLTLWALSMD